MKLTRQYPMLGSSVDPNKWSRTIKTLPTLIVFVLMMLGIDMPESEVDNIVQLVLVAGNAVVTAFYGSLRVYNKYLKPWWESRKKS